LKERESERKLLNKNIVLLYRIHIDIINNVVSVAKI